jgi:3-oxoadipate enol-lactonase
MEVSEFEKLSEPVTSIYYLDPNPAGHPVVILLHGLGAEASSWGYQLDSLVEAGMRPLAIDIPGFGKSKFKGTSWSFSGLSQLVFSFLEHLSIIKPVVVGISMGGILALQFTLDYPKDIDKLVLVNSFATLRPNTINGWLYMLKRYIKASLRGSISQADMVAQRIFPRPEQYMQRKILIEEIQQADPQVYKAAMRALGFFDARRRLIEINLPTLIISGKNDTTVPLENQAQLLKISGAKRIIIPDGGHAIIADQPERFNHALLDFICSE